MSIRVDGDSTGPGPLARAPMPDSIRAAAARIAFVSTYPPRRCGIATFTADLGRAMGAHEIVALRGPNEAGPSAPIVHHEIRTDVPADFTWVARSLKRCGIDVVSLQHEYGIWGADHGEGVLDFLAALDVPVVATLHTVLRHPTAAQRRIMRGILDGATTAVVMSQAAATLLTDRYAADPTRLEVVPHGVPDLPFVDPDSLKPSVGLQGRRVLLSFGLLGPGKGYESVIAAMPAVVRAIPDACYVIVGATHPEQLRAEGETYRTRLEALAVELGVAEHVRFVDRFVGRLELHQWLAAADVFVTPYPNAEQVVSGTLSYALAAGKATVSTPYPYASEVLDEGRGILVPAEAPAAMGDALIALLQDHRSRAAMAERAYAHGRKMVWSRVAESYARLFTQRATGQRDLASLTVHAVPVKDA